MNIDIKINQEETKRAIADKMGSDDSGLRKELESQSRAIQALSKQLSGQLTKAEVEDIVTKEIRSCMTDVMRDKKYGDERMMKQIKNAVMAKMQKMPRDKSGTPFVRPTTEPYVS